MYHPGTYGSVIWSYGNSAMETTVTDPDNREKTTIKDHLGRITRVIEDGGQNTDYSYNAAGDLTEVDPPGGVDSTIIQYDLLGRKTDMNDPDMGYWEYHYDANDVNGNKKCTKNGKIKMYHPGVH